jgi:hypothetical protein
MSDALDFPELFRALDEWARAAFHGVRAGGDGGGGFDHIQLHTRPVAPEPERQLTLRACLIAGRPVIAVTRSPEPPERGRLEAREDTVVGLGPGAGEDEGGGGRDPNAECAGCGVSGTVGWAARTDTSGAVLETHRFCAACWPEQAARYRARWEEEDRRHADALLRGRAPAAAGAGRGMWFEAATWHGTLDLVRQIEQTMVAPVPPAPADLARLAEEIRGRASQIEGEMPWEVEAFLHRYGTPAG